MFKIKTRILVVSVSMIWGAVHQSTIGFAQTSNLIPPPGSDSFGTYVCVLSNGNFVVTDPAWDSAGMPGAGAVHLYDGASLNRISTLHGSKPNDHIGKGGIVALPNGNFIVLSPDWNITASSGQRAGAVTWINGRTGLSGSVNAVNSLVGSSANDRIGHSDEQEVITVLTNGHFVIASPEWKDPAGSRKGAATWGNMASGVQGTITASNSLVKLYDFPGSAKCRVYALANGNYVVRSGFETRFGSKGSVTWGNGSTGSVGVVDSMNSLIGRMYGDDLGNQVVPLTNGNYVITGGSFMEGLATFLNGSIPAIGHIDPAFSLSGEGHYINVTPLTNGNYVVSSPAWAPPGGYSQGSVTWGNGSTGTYGKVDASNSLLGTNPIDQVGWKVVPLANGNYVVVSPFWQNGSHLFAGAVTFCDGFRASNGDLNSTNSLVGSKTDDHLGYGGVYALSNGDYVVSSPQWDSGLLIDAGAVTWGNGLTGTAGIITQFNSLIGNNAKDSVGNGGVFPLGNGDYVVASPYWDSGTVQDAGAVTYASGSTGLNRFINPSNSLIGSIDFDRVGSAGVRVLNNHNYVVSSPNWNKALGAATWGDGKKGITGFIDAKNSLVGGSLNDSVGKKIIALANGNFLVESASWTDTVLSQNHGALTPGDGRSGIRGYVDSVNSLIGLSYPNAYRSNTETEVLGNGDYLLTNRIPPPQSGISAYAAYGNRQLSGTANSCKAIFSVAPGSAATMHATFNSNRNFMLVGLPVENRVAVFRTSGPGLAEDQDTARHGLSANANFAIPFVNPDGCRLVSALLPVNPSPINRNVVAVALVEPTAPSILDIPYVRRHFDINPEFESDAVTNRITLYFNQSDFSDYNSHNGLRPELPVSGSDNAGKSRLRIIQEYGTSPNGKLGSYTGNNPVRFTVINPADSNIVWNNSSARWEITFDATGFGGFFAYTEGGSTEIANVVGRNTAAVTASPIPTSDLLYIRVNDPKLYGTVASLTDLQGRTLRSFSLSQDFSLNIQELPAGVYLLHLQNASVMKILKQ